MRFAIPLSVFILIVGLLAYGLRLDPKNVPSPLIGKPAPAFSLAKLDAPQLYLAKNDLLGQVWVLNVWASWCVSCRAEHEIITRLSALNLAPVIGLNYKDDPDDARRWLQQFGDPYTASIMDADGRVGIDWGVYGVPETFIIDKDGLIKYKHIGPVTHESLETEVLPVLLELTS
ncbi:MAG: DsbE family thiol:disulfide interchange protein [Gammaproteobacteria bacterium]|nr:DsbE family thiol:disulfide interchange protein [Gammaproteobacteria bacterium]MCZ6722677.1 DsbE family thiol:disulfide interchange protein [Gammaproteobacteria bacterium]MCZ6882005.1 DsbE family thiol:disulfide interchange protein [Gammaproteobacteria bacterium]